MSEDPGHKAMLYFLEVLMNSNGPLTISQLAGRFGSRSFSAEMRSAAGGNESGLKKFFLKYPSLFTVNGNMVSLFDSSKALEEPAKLGGGTTGVTPSGRSLPDVSAEMDAVQYFRNKLLKKEEHWVPIKSLAGHLSQAAHEIRQCVGPQLEFRNFLLRHQHIFEVQGELVGLRDGIEAVTQPTPVLSRRSLMIDSDLANGFDAKKTIPPKTPPAARKFPPKSPTAIRRSHSFSERRSIQQPQIYDTSPIVAGSTTPLSRRRNAPVTMTANEYKAVMFLKDIVEKRGGIKVHNITGHFSQAAEGVRNTIGWTKTDLEEFLKKNANVFHVCEDELVTVNKNAKLNVIITGSRPQGQNTRTISGRKGRVFHVAKLWGIIDLGKHEHVFFDKSIMRRPIDDLQKEYKIGEILYFNAVLAVKTSRAKWRATHVWKEHELEPAAGDYDSSVDGYPLSPSTSIEDEINRFLPCHDYDDSSDHFIDAQPSGAGNVPVWRMKDNHVETNGHEDLIMQSENNFMSSSVNLDSTPKTSPRRNTASSADDLIKPSPPDGPKLSLSPKLKDHSSPIIGRHKKYVEIACQTVSTGEIIATQLYQEE